MYSSTCSEVDKYSREVVIQTAINNSATIHFALRPLGPTHIANVGALVVHRNGTHKIQHVYNLHGHICVF